MSPPGNRVAGWTAGPLAQPTNRKAPACGSPAEVANVVLHGLAAPEKGGSQ
jgi:hypothetical protein